MHLIRTILLIISPIVVTAQAFVQLGDFPGGKRDDGVAVVLNGKAYFGTGLHDFFSATIDYRVLDLQTDVWSTMQDMPHTTERQYACAFTGTNSFYITLGTGVGGALTSTYRYNVNSNDWTQMASKPGAGLIGAVSLQFNDKVIIAGGKFNDGKLNREVWQYDIPSNNWTQKNNFPFVPVWRASAAVNDGTGYLLFGIDSADKFQRVLYGYDVANDTWTSVSTFPLAQGRAYAAMQSHNKRLFVFGGMDSLQNYYNDSWYFDPAVPLWFQGPLLPGAGRRGGMSCGSAEFFYYTCGLAKNGRLAETWKTDVPAAISNHLNEQTIEVYPNPFNEQLFIVAGTAEFKWKLCNAQGQLVLQGESKATNLTDCSQLSRGLYLLTIESETGKTLSRKLVKQ